jgi:UDP-3-O-[3-hydroxymyristoyl] glucosamine N-acyltransferase (EC 2.3.1.-)
VEIGENTVMAAQVGIAGSAKVGKHCMFGGQVGIAGHITIPDKVNFGLRRVRWAPESKKVKPI